MKRCNKCGQEKPRSKFYKDRHNPDGLGLKCKACVDASMRSWRARNPDRHRSYVAAYAAKHPERVKASYERWKKRHPDRAKEKFAAWVARYPEHAKARLAYMNALRSGKLVRPSRCSECGAEAKRIEGHHDDYSRPLEIRWLCKRCHVKADQLRRVIALES
jgi:hypothetical protein